MTKLITIDHLKELLAKHGRDTFAHDLMQALEKDYARWHDFKIMPRPAIHVPDGVIELMPVADQQYYTYKYVNGHPKNPLCNKLTVMATGQLSRVDDGEPLLISEMTYLTAIRTAANSALATNYMARKNASSMAMIGTGAQSEFQLHAIRTVRDIHTVYYYDTDPTAMDKFERNTHQLNISLIRCNSPEQAVRNADIITVCTACKMHVDVVKNEWVKPGAHINGIGGDCPGKTEIETSLVERSRIVVEYFDQAYIEGEIQRWSKAEARNLVAATLHELVTGKKKGRESNDEITLFDSVGIALEDFTTLVLLYKLAAQYGIGEEIYMVPELTNPIDLWSTL